LLLVRSARSPAQACLSQNHLGRLAFWSVDRDQPCGGSATSLPACSEISQQPLDFTKIFLKYTG